MPTGSELTNLEDLKQLSDYTIAQLNSKSERIVSFSAGKPLAIRDAASNVSLISAEVTLMPTLEGTGDASPDNIRNIVGKNSVQVKVCPSYDFNENQTQTYTVTFPQTVYGGTVNVINGVYSSGYRYLQFNGASTDGWSAQAVRGTVSCFQYSLEEGDDPSNVSNAICNMFPMINGAIDDTEGFYFSGRFGMLNTLNIQIRTDRLSENTVNGLMSFFNEHPLQLFYESDYGSFDFFSGIGVEIKTLTDATVNYITTDAESIYIEYYSVTEDYLKNITNAQDRLASSAISSGDYFFLGNSLCIATENIARGAEISVGINCTKTDLATVLNVLKNGS